MNCCKNQSLTLLTTAILFTLTNHQLGYADSIFASSGREISTPAEIPHTMTDSPTVKSGENPALLPPETSSTAARKIRDDDEGFNPFGWLLKEEKTTRSLYEKQAEDWRSRNGRKKETNSSWFRWWESPKNSSAKSSQSKAKMNDEARDQFSQFGNPRMTQPEPESNFFQNTGKKFSDWNHSLRENSKANWESFKRKLSSSDDSTP